MKKIVSLLMVVMVMLMPMVTNALAVEVVRNANGELNCVAGENENVQNCTVSVNITGGELAEGQALEFSLTEKNATVDTTSITGQLDWTMQEFESLDNLVFVANGNLTGEVQVFAFTYEKNTEAIDECKVTLDLKGFEKTKDEDEQVVEEVKTGVTLPYVFLGGAALLAGYAFITTKNKSKMHRI